ncbi:phosphoheptose isomerase [Ktedonobacter sp. SOSP1-85]|uniref:D-sedoheptulose-7-phosphate isomerase n=1 Tax=Ktedonobacter sp. SOSP1-85 TaxID=2778367 RepID=UPI0019159572|nr:SIS domain-containing protein [Ktedonobacter sp. SOSP1-85]GHO72959.1 phosphoheptose isomerase [Ktedonobacter sp. SOSP1-85]
MTQAMPQKHVDLRTLVEARFAQSTSVPETFFAAQAPHIAEACWAMARRFHQQGRLIAFGNGAWATDAQHISVEFVHPVIVGKRALPAMALTNDSATISGLMAGGAPTMPFARQLQALARPQDIAVGYSVDGQDANVLAGLALARQRGLLTLALLGRDGGEIARSDLDFCFVVQAEDPLVIQETHETLYHVLWELVHVFFEHEGLLSQ